MPHCDQPIFTLPFPNIDLPYQNIPTTFLRSGTLTISNSYTSIIGSHFLDSLGPSLTIGQEEQQAKIDLSIEKQEEESYKDESTTKEDELIIEENTADLHYLEMPDNLFLEEENDDNLLNSSTSEIPLNETDNLDETEHSEVMLLIQPDSITFTNQQELSEMEEGNEEILPNASNQLSSNFDITSIESIEIFETSHDQSDVPIEHPQAAEILDFLGL